MKANLPGASSFENKPAALAWAPCHGGARQGELAPGRCGTGCARRGPEICGWRDAKGYERLRQVAGCLEGSTDRRMGRQVYGANANGLCSPWRRPRERCGR